MQSKCVIISHGVIDTVKVAMGRNFGIHIRKAACEGCIVAWNIVTCSEVFSRTKENHENLNLTRWSRILPEACYILACIRHLITRTLNAVHIGAVSVFWMYMDLQWTLVEDLVRTNIIVLVRHALLWGEGIFRNVFLEGSLASSAQHKWGLVLVPRNKDSGVSSFFN
jgi:hypothetical protein